MTPNLSLKSPLKSEPKQGMNIPSKKSQAPRVNAPKKRHHYDDGICYYNNRFSNPWLWQNKYSEGAGGSLPRFGPNS